MEAGGARAGRPGSDMEGFFNPRSVAVAGASRSGMKLGNVPIANMRKFGYRGRVFPIHPDAGEVMGLRAYPAPIRSGGLDV